jgi:hypothetical protein
MEEAVAAHQNQDINRLNDAYAINAYASHFLTDRYSAGHLRTPRYELDQTTTPSIIGSALSNYMHGEENISGLHVYNQRGDHWIAFGDKAYFKPESKMHRKMIHEAIQDSADQVFFAYLSGYIDPKLSVENLIPIPQETNNYNEQDLSPMFYWDPKSKTMLRRKHLNRPFERVWTNDWWGWTTLLELKKDRSISYLLQAELAHSHLGYQALKAGLITESSLIHFIQEQKQ